MSGGDEHTLSMCAMVDECARTAAAAAAAALSSSSAAAACANAAAAHARASVVHAIDALRVAQECHRDSGDWSNLARFHAEAVVLRRTGDGPLARQYAARTSRGVEWARGFAQNAGEAAGSANASAEAAQLVAETALSITGVASIATQTMVSVDAIDIETLRQMHFQVQDLLRMQMAAHGAATEQSRARAEQAATAQEAHGRDDPAAEDDAAEDDDWFEAESAHGPEDPAEHGHHAEPADGPAELVEHGTALAQAEHSPAPGQGCLGSAPGQTHGPEDLAEHGHVVEEADGPPDLVEHGTALAQAEHGTGSAQGCLGSALPTTRKTLQRLWRSAIAVWGLSSRPR